LALELYEEDAILAANKIAVSTMLQSPPRRAIPPRRPCWQEWCTKRRSLPAPDRLVDDTSVRTGNYEGDRAGFDATWQGIAHNCP